MEEADAVPGDDVALQVPVIPLAVRLYSHLQTLPTPDPTYVAVYILKEVLWLCKSAW
jgi:hypothetical protein